MHILLSTLALLAAGGGAALLTHRRPRLMRTLYALINGIACLLALSVLPAMLRQEMPSTFSCSWLWDFTLSFALNPLSLPFLLPILVLSPLIALYGCQYLKPSAHPWKAAVNFCLFNLLVIAMVLLTLADNIPSFVLAWEWMSVTSFLLVLYECDEQETQKAAYRYLLFTQAGALCIFAAFGLLFAATGSLDFTRMAQAPQAVKTAAFLLALAGFGSKAGMFPLHVWLPQAHPAAPSHVSALLSGVMIKMGAYGIIRLYFLLDDHSLFFGQVLVPLGIASAILGVIYALGKQDLKRLLAYSSIENMGIVLIGFGLGMLGLGSGNAAMAACGFAGGMLHVLNHALFKSLLFMGAGAVLHASGERRLDRLGGLMKRMPVTGRSFLVGTVALSGLPPLNGFVSEFLIYLAAFQGLGAGNAVMLFAIAAIIALAVTGGLALACFTKVLGIAFLGEPRTEQARAARECGRAMQAALLLPALACLLIGLWPEPFVQLASFSLQGLLPPGGEMAASASQNLGLASRLFFLLLLVLVLIRHLCYRAKTVRQGPTWGCGFTRPSTRIQYTGASYAESMVSFHHPFARISTRYSGIGDNKIFPGPASYETRTEDLAELWLQRFLTPAIFRAAAWLHWIQRGRIQLYIAYIVVIIVVLLFTV